MTFEVDGASVLYKRGLRLEVEVERYMDETETLSQFKTADLGTFLP